MIKDHLGNKYKSQAEMLRRYGVTRSTFNARLKAGRTLEECLSGETLNYRSHAVDHLGNKYAGLDDMLKHYGINKNTYCVRLHRGWTLERTLTTPNRIEAKAREREQSRQTVEKLAEKYGISAKDLELIIKEGGKYDR